MIDLHLHTNYSDGADSLIDVLKKAESLNLKYISITDHDNCEAYEELKKIDIKKYYTGTIIPGVEIKCAYGSKLIEILGYNIKTDVINQYMREFHKTHSKELIQQKYFDILYEKSLEMGLLLSNKEEINFDAKKDWASIAIYNEIKKHKINETKLPEDLWSEFNIFSKKYCGNQEFPLYIDKSKDYLSVKDAIKLVRDANGLVFLPHVFIYKWAEDKYKLLDKLVKEFDIDGIECMHSEFSKEEIEYLLEYTEKNKYYRSGGSDYHGVNKPNIDMAIGKGNLNILETYIMDWVDKK